MAKFTSPLILSNSGHQKDMEEKISQYNGLITRAERQESIGRGVTVEVAELYMQASKVCGEIMNMNFGSRAVYEQWNRRKLNAEEKAIKITNTLNPPTPKPVKQPVPAAPAGGGKTAPAAAPASAPQSATKSGDVYTTASGFQTRNAIPGVVEAETIERWFPAKPKHDFNDVKGMEDLKDRLMREAGTLDWSRIDAALDISPVQSYFFYGPPGTGKTFVIEAFAHELMNKGFNYIKLVGGDIHQGLVGVAEKIVKIAFEEAIDKEPCIVFIDEIDNVCVDRTDDKAANHERSTTVAFLQAYNELKASGKRVVFIGATNHPAKVDSAMMDRVKMVRVPLPPVETRESVFANRFKTMALEPGFTFRDMAELTDNYSMRDIGNLVDTILIETRDRTVSEYRVESESGEVDKEQTDIRGSEALHEKQIVLTREQFLKTQATIPPSDKSKSREELKQFEENLGMNF